MRKAIELSRRFESDELVRIELEDSTKVFRVQAALLCNASPYFEKALTGNFEESKDKVLRLPGCDEPTFQLFLYWLCNRDLPTEEETTSDEEEPIGPRVLVTQFWMVRLWMFAETLLLPVFQNQAMKRLLELFGECLLNPAVARCAFEHLGEHSRIRTVVVLEIVGDYIAGNLFSKQKMDDLASMKGFMMNFVNTLWVNKDKKVNEVRPSALREEKFEQFTVLA